MAQWQRNDDNGNGWCDGNGDGWGDGDGNGRCNINAMATMAVDSAKAKAIHGAAAVQR